MTPYTWPATLPCFRFEPYSLNPRSGAIQIDSGPITERARVYVENNDSVSCEIVVTRAQEIIFRNFWQSTLGMGTQTFLVDIFANAAQESREALFTGTPVYQPIANGWSRISFSLLTWPAQVDPPPDLSKWLNHRDARNPNRTYVYEYVGTTRNPEVGDWPTRTTMEDALADAASDLGFDPGVIFGWRNVEDETVLGPPSSNITDFDADTLEFHINDGNPESIDFYGDLVGSNQCQAMSTVVSAGTVIWWKYTQFPSVFGSGLFQMGEFGGGGTGWQTLGPCAFDIGGYFLHRPDAVIRVTVQP